MASEASAPDPDWLTASFPEVVPALYAELRILGSSFACGPLQSSLPMRQTVITTCLVDSDVSTTSGWREVVVMFVGKLELPVISSGSFKMTVKDCLSGPDL